MKLIYTIGYGDKDFDQLINLLKKTGIKRVVDVRSFPSSKWPEFEKENLEQELPERKIDYIHLEGLGGYRDEGYKEYMKTEEFKNSLNKLEELAAEKKTVVMCLESYPSGCHRRYISQKLSEKGWKIKHLVGKKGKQKTL